MSRTISERLAAEQNRHADEIAAIEAEALLARLCPIEPDIVHFASKPEPWITYKVKTVPDVLPLLAAFAPAAGAAVEDGCVYVGPHAEQRLQADRGKLRWRAAELVVVNLEQGRGFGTYGLAWWAQIGDKVCRIKIEVAGWPWKARPQSSVTYDARGNVRRATHELPDLGEWRRIKWGSFLRDACYFSLYFETRASAAEWLKAIEERP